MLQAGKLRRMVTLRTLSQEQNEYGEPIDTWSTAINLWASIEPLRGGELLLAQQVSAELTHRVIVRYDSSAGIDPTDRIYYGSRILEIVNVMNSEEKNEFLELLCKEIV